MAEVKSTICHMCLWNCWIKATIEDGKVLRVESHPGRPSLAGYDVCTKAQKALLEYTFHPDRLNHPLKRVGARGEGKWEQISWEQALDEIAAKLGQIKEKYGPEAVVLGTGTPRGTHSDHLKYTFGHLFGTPNILSPNGNFCLGPHVRWMHITNGWGYSHVVPVPGVTKCYLTWGGNQDVGYMNPPGMVKEMRAAGAKTIVIDPRFSEVAEQCDIWLRIRPGTDGALAMAFVNTIIEEDLYDKEFVDKWTYGFDELRQKVKEMPAEKAEEITGVPAAKIREAARVYATNKPATFYYGMGTTHQGLGVDSAQMYMVAMREICGNIDVEGGEYLPGTNLISAYEESMFPPGIPHGLTDEQGMKQLGNDRFKLLGHRAWREYIPSTLKYWKKPLSVNFVYLCSWPMATRAILTEEPYPVKALVMNACNYLFSFGNTKHTYQALKSSNLELFVATDIFMTPYTALADYVFPATSTFERPALEHFLGFMDGCMADTRMLPPTAERQDDYQVYRGLAERLKIQLPYYKGPGYWPDTLEHFYDWMLANAIKPMGKTFEELAATSPLNGPEPVFKKHEQFNADTGGLRGFGTPTGKVELNPTILPKLGFELPSYNPPADSPMANPDLAQEYPFQMFTGPRNPYYYFTEGKQCTGLRREYPYPRVQIHPKDSMVLGVADGEWVYIETNVGRIRQIAMVTTEVPQGVVHVEFGWWLPEQPTQEPWLGGMWDVNASILVDDDPDKLGAMAGETMGRACMCRIVKAPQYAEVPWMEKPANAW
jgi:thiosulfate reductase / polysulfide reductase chain A